MKTRVGFLRNGIQTIISRRSRAEGTFRLIKTLRQIKWSDTEFFLHISTYCMARIYTEMLYWLLTSRKLLEIFGSRVTYSFPRLRKLNTWIYDDVMLCVWTVWTVCREMNDRLHVCVVWIWRLWFIHWPRVVHGRPVCATVAVDSGLITLLHLMSLILLNCSF